MKTNSLCKIQSLNFSFGKHKILKDVSLEIKKGRCLAILGASGSGKTTLGKILAGLILPHDPSSITWQHETSQETSALEQKRLRQLVFQDPSASLTPFYTPFKTIFEVLKLHYPNSKDYLENQTAQILERFGLYKDLFHRKIKCLSGGQKQRLNLARAYCLKPDLLILDEPLSSCDVFLQKEILDLLKKTIQESNLTCVIILHDLYQAAYIADTICLLNEGSIDSIGSKETFLKSPPTPYAQKFLESFLT
jgi:ABC-type dipeptide/oligopeptide/nickel transport system ATPase subunit